MTELRAEINLNEKVLTSIIESSIDGFWRVDRHGRILDVNQQACDMLGYTRKELLQLSVLDVEAAESAAEFKSHAEEIAIRGSDRFESIYRHKNGNLLNVELSVQFVETPGEASQGFFVAFVRDITVAKQAHKRLIESERQYRDLVQTSQDLVFQCDVEGRYTFLSEQWEDVFEYSINEMLGRPFTDFQSPEMAARDAREFARLLSMASVRGYTTVHKSKSGRDIHLSFNARYIVDPDGKVIGTAGTAHDITVLEEAIESMREEQQFTDTLIDALEDTFFLFDPTTGKAIRWNKSFSRITGYSDEEIARLPAPQSYYSESAMRAATHVMKEVMTDGSGTIELELVCKDGRKVPTEYRVSRIAGQPENANLMISIGRDLTHLRRMEQDYQILFSGMLNGFALHEIICDESGTPVDYRFLAVNPAFEKMTGLTREIVGRTIRELMPAIEHSWIERYGKVALSGEPTFFEDYNTATRKHFEVTAYRPAPMQFACIFADITQRRELEERLRHSQKMDAIGHLAGGIAHDFNNILGGIVGFADMSLELVPKGEILHGYLTRILSASDRARKLVQQILSFSRQSRLEMVAVYVNPIVQEIVLLLRASLPSSIEIVSIVEKESAPVNADATRIHEIVMNLCTNAAHAMKNEQGVMEITCGDCIVHQPADGILGPIEKGDYCRIKVVDNGCGMAPETLNRAFEPFFTTREVGQGTGMGLATVFGIVESHQGNMRVSSALGQGTTFEIFLPHTTNVPELQQKIPEDISGGNEHILVVDDEPLLCEMLESFLVNMGYAVTASTSSVHALELFKDSPSRFDLVVTDQTMPTMSGLELARQLIDLQPNLPVILTTGYSRQVDESVARSEGLAGYLMKPVRKKALADLIRKTLNPRLQSH